MSKSRLIVVVTMILAAAASRLIPHPPNVASVTAVALFGGAYLPRKWLAFLVPVVALLLSDLIIGFYSHMESVYGSFAVVVCIGLWLRGRCRAPAIAAAALASSTLFFLVTNFSVWFWGSSYPRTAAGLLACYVAAIPFFRNTLIGDALYTTVLFGGLALAEKHWPVLRESAFSRPRSF